MRQSNPAIKFFNFCFSGIKQYLPALGYVALALLLLYPLTFLAEKSSAWNEHRVAMAGADGYYDLSNADFEHNYYDLYGTAYYPGVYLLPSEIDRAESREHTREAEYCTLHMSLTMPDDEAYLLDFRFPGATYAGRVYINGKLELTGGRPGTSLSETEPVKGGLYDRYELYAAPEDGVIDIVCHFANFHHIEKGIGEFEVFIAKSGFIQQYGAFDLGKPYRVLIIGALFGFSLLLFSLWLTHVKTTQNLWFALVVFVMAVRRCVLAGMGPTLFSFLPGPQIVRLEYYTVSLITIFMFLYMGKAFPGLYQRFFKWYTCLGALGYLSVTIFTTNVFFTWCLRFWYPFYVSFLLYTLARLLWRFKRPTNDQAIAVAGYIVLVISNCNDMLLLNAISTVFGWIDMTESAWLIMVLTQTVALFLSNARITAEAKAAERTLSEENAMLDKLNQAKTEFLANASHEMRTPLTIISVNVQIVSGILKRMEEVALDPKAEELLADAQNEIMRLARMVGGMLTLASISEGADKRKVDLSVLLQGVMDLLRIHLQERGNEPETEIEDELIVFCDADLLAQVVINLIQNANKHTANGAIALCAARRGSEIIVLVADDGSGISPELLPRLFERGVSDGGTGFGLYICKTVVESHGGHIWIESEQGIGTTVYFTLPVYEGQFGGELPKENVTDESKE